MKGIKAIITSCTEPLDCLRALKVVDMYPGKVFLTIGADPALTLEDDKVLETIDLIRRHRKKIVGIGEVGLDYYYIRDEETRGKQRRNFKVYINVAKKENLPMIIHSRSAGKYALDLLTSEGARKVVLHAFDGKVGTALRGVENGYFFSIPPSVARSRQKQKLVKIVPLDNLLLESDSPVLGPRIGEINTPLNIEISCKMIGEIKGVDFEVVKEVTTKNALNIFKEMRKYLKTDGGK